MEKIPLFQPFKDVNQGFERLKEIIESVENVDAKYRLILWGACFWQTLVERDKNIRKDLDEVDAEMRKNIAGGES